MNPTFQIHPTQLLLQKRDVMSFSTRSKLIGSIAGVGAAALVVIGLAVPSGATFTATKPAHVSIATASLSLGVSDDDNSGTIDLGFTNLKPGETQSLKFNVTNTGTIDATGKVGSNFTEATPPANVDYNLLKVGVRNDGTKAKTVTPVTQLPASWDLGVIKAGQTRTYYVDVQLDQSAGNEWQGQTFAGNIPVTLTQQDAGAFSSN